LKHNLWREECTVLFVGYQADGTLGRKLIDGADSVSLFNEEIAVNARIASIVGISGHADRDMLLNWLGSMDEAPKKVFVNHGQDIVCENFVHTIRTKLGFSPVAPYSGDEYDLVTGLCTEHGRVVKVTKVTEGRRRANLAFDKLMQAIGRLKTVAELSRGLSNKELAKFTNQINDLCDKYIRKANRR
jgi:metallo-beta-lactamase family protein